MNNWPPRDWRAFIALVASVAGAIVLTAYAAWLAWILWDGRWPADTAQARVDALGKAMLGSLVTIGLVLLALGMAINRRTFKGSIGSANFEATGGDEAGGVAENLDQAGKALSGAAAAITPPIEEQAK